MIRTRTHDFDNRDSGQMYDYLEARVDALKRRIAELEDENAVLTSQWSQARVSKPDNSLRARGSVQRPAIAQPPRATGTLAFKVAQNCP
jgi:phage shock protein A